MANSSDVRKIQEECRSMASLLKKLEGEELALRAQNSILAREVVNFGGIKSAMPELDLKGKQKQPQKLSSASVAKSPVGGSKSGDK